MNENEVKLGSGVTSEKWRSEIKQTMIVTYLPFKYQVNLLSHIAM